MYNNNNYQIEKTYTNKTSSLALIALNISLCYLILTTVPSQLKCSMIILTKKVALIFFLNYSRHCPWTFETTVFLCPYVEMTLNLKWLVSRCHMLIGVGYCQNINCDENGVLSLMNDLMPMIMKITTMTWLSTRILWDIRSPLGEIVSLGTISSIITHMIKTIINYWRCWWC